MSVSQSCQRSASCRLIRSRRANVIVFMVAVSCTFLLAFMLFALSFTRLVGTNHEQKCGIDAAALAAAKAVSRIVVDDPNLGLIGISDSAPIGAGTIAGDNYYTQVHSINSILGTIRLDMIIANEIGDPVMLAFAQRDYANARAAADNLTSVLQASLLPSGGGSVSAAAASPGGGTSGGGNGNGNGGSTTSYFVDAFGNQVFPYDDAVAAYRANQIRMAGQSQYVDGSMKLSLGSLVGGGPTNTPIPQPDTYAYASGNLSYEGKYMSYVDVAYNGTDFVFAGVGDAIKLVDTNKFVTNDDSLPYTIPTIVKAEADQMFLEGHDIGGRIVHAIACAQPASTVDPLPAPGKLGIEFPGPKIGRLTKPGDLITDPETGTPPAKITSPGGGDKPGGGSSAPVTWPIAPGGGTPTIGQVISGGFYDWLKRAGTKANVNAVKAMMTQPFLASSTVTSGIMQNYEFEADGTILQTLHVSVLKPALSESEKQWKGKAKFTDSVSGITFSVTVKNYVRHPGRKNGGKHSGEPLADPLLDTTVLASYHITGSSLAQGTPANATEIAQGLELGAGGCGAGGPPCGGGGCGGGGICGGNEGDEDDDDDGDGSCGSTINFSQGPCGNGAVRDTYLHNGIAVDIQYAPKGSGGAADSGTTTSTASGG
ncbi:MAG: hypothetical protein C5B53_05180 [Candidatus Melainabacteria bacterium]|nr:MAG: hypothetical protein C5B53_05180 [Candidatus Melainabacteria bacterium]